MKLPQAQIYTNGRGGSNNAGRRSSAVSEGISSLRWTCAAEIMAGLSCLVLSHEGIIIITIIIIIIVVVIFILFVIASVFPSPLLVFEATLPSGYAMGEPKPRNRGWADAQSGRAEELPLPLTAPCILHSTPLLIGPRLTAPGTALQTVDRILRTLAS